MFLARFAIAGISMLLADATSGDPLIDWIVANASAVGILAFIIVGLIRGWLVTGREHARVLEERNRALELVYAQAEATSRALEVAEKRA